MGDVMTFDEFTRQQLPPLLRFAKVLCGDRALAEDVVQEVLIRLHARWSQLDQVTRLDAYVRKMIVNEYVSWRRKWARVVPLPNVWPHEFIPDHADAHAARDALVAEMAKLPPKQRAVIVLRYYGGLSDAEIADTLECADSTVRAYATRALATLRVQARAETATRRTS
jgi:RNA polymerase sigma-70 factor (sigma-E family)